MTGVDPLVDVVIPTFRRPRMLQEALNSALGQSLTQLRVIVTCDGAAAESLGGVTGLEDPRVTVRADGVRRGQVGNTIAGVDVGAAPYVAILHDDDVWERDFLATLVPPLDQQPDLVVAFADHHIIRGDGSLDDQATEQNTLRWGRRHLAPGRHAPMVELALATRSLPIMAAVYRRDSIDWHDFPDGVDQMFDFWLAYLAARGRGGAFFVPERLTRYRSHDGSVTGAGGSQRALAFVRSRQLMLVDPAVREAHPQLERDIEEHRRVLLEALVAEGRGREARPLARAALRGRPDVRTTSAALLAALPPTVARRLREALIRVGRRSRPARPSAG